uniref:hypothetical protein n=1 Tax=Helicobacter pylori TaxID=210 RepID=UPI001E5B3472
LVSVEESRMKGASKYGLSPCKWISTCGGDPHVRLWREAVIFGTDENKKKITTILRKFKGSKFKLYIYGAENGYTDGVIFSFHFDLKKDTQSWCEIEFKDFSEILLTLESKVKEAREKHDAKVKEEEKEEEKEKEMIEQEIKKARDFISLEREKGTHEIIAFSSNIKSLIMGIAKREGVEISKIEHLVDYLSLCYYRGFKDISTSRITDRWIFLEAYNNIGKLKSVYILFDFMRDLKGDLIDNCKLIIAKD